MEFIFCKKSFKLSDVILNGSSDSSIAFDGSFSSDFLSKSVLSVNIPRLSHCMTPKRMCLARYGFIQSPGVLEQGLHLGFNHSNQLITAKSVFFLNKVEQKTTICLQFGTNYMYLYPALPNGFFSRKKLFKNDKTRNLSFKNITKY